MDSFTFRDADYKDYPFILDSWGSSYYKGSNGRILSALEFHGFHRCIRDKIIKDSGARIKICCPESDPWIIIGWILYQSLSLNMLIHYLYVKNAFRGHHIGRDLINRVVTNPNNVTFISHRTMKAAEIMERHPDQFHNYQFMPHLI